MQALVQYSNAAEAGSAKAALEGHAIYDGGYNRVGRCEATMHAVLLHCHWSLMQTAAEI